MSIGRDELGNNVDLLFDKCINICYGWKWFLGFWEREMCGEKNWIRELNKVLILVLRNRFRLFIILILF